MRSTKTKIIETDALIIGAGPVGLFAVFELGLLGIKAHVIDILNKPGGQCAELYPEKPIYDIPGFPMITGQNLCDNLMQQIKPFNPIFHFSELAETLIRTDNGSYEVETNGGLAFNAKIIVIAAGGGSFEPKRPPIKNIEHYEGHSVLYSIGKINDFAGKSIVIVGGGDSALDWTIALQKVAKNITLVHRRDKFTGAVSSVQKVMELRDKNKILFKIGQITEIIENQNKMTGVVFKSEEQKLKIDCDILMPFFGLTMNIGPLIDWGLSIDNKRIAVNTETFETNLPGVFAIGDINIYPGKLKLILSGFHESALMAHAAYKIIFPTDNLVFQYTTSSSSLQKKLGII
ncbi:MAG: NAD(P)/FAD-dependent oxidoreductase [Alphaproteobacteria bacterium]|jgi:thioredoxin reductase (NADPH)|tara:strand:+ start:521 stop:1558 length:1038 start_codon:yes stop_codon:yes gene_type:complete